MSLVANVKACKTPAEAILLLAQAIDELRAEQNDPWNQPLLWEPGPDAEPSGPAVTVEQTGEDQTTVVLAAPSEEKLQKRARFALEQLKLHEALPELGDEAIRAYAKGGPLWLWYGNRQLLMQYPVPMRQQMVDDVLEDDPETAHEMGRDVLKFDGSEGPGQVLGRLGLEVPE